MGNDGGNVPIRYPEYLHGWFPTESTIQKIYVRMNQLLYTKVFEPELTCLEFRLDLMHGGEKWFALNEWIASFWCRTIVPFDSLRSVFIYHPDFRAEVSETWNSYMIAWEGSV